MQKKYSMIYWILLPTEKEGCIKQDQCQVNSMWLELTYYLNAPVNPFLTSISQDLGTSSPMQPCRTLCILSIQPWPFDIKLLLNKPCVNIVILRRQNLSWKCCQSLELLTCIGKGFRSFHTFNNFTCENGAKQYFSLRGKDNDNNLVENLISTS